MSAGTRICTLLLGALFSASATEAPVTNASNASVHPPDPLTHWAFRPLTRPPLPSVRNRPWVRTPIDAFVAAEHENHGLSPAPEARKEILLRRVYLDLIGLPPGRDELQRF